MTHARSFAGQGKLSRFAVALLLLSTELATGASEVQAAEGIFDEMRFGAKASIGDGDNHESGVFPSFTIFFDPLGADTATGIAEKILRPRIHAGASIATSSSGVNDVYGGLSWDADLTERLFVEVGVPPFTTVT